MTMRPDPTFHASPKLAMEAPPENFAYTLLLSPDFSKPDALAVIDAKPGSPTFSQVVHMVTMPYKGDEFHHFGWNACSSALSPLTGHAFLERRYLIIPGLRSSRIYIVDTKPDRTQAKIHKISEPEEVFKKTGYSRPHTVHCGPEVTDPRKPKLAGSVHIGGIARRTPHPNGKVYGGGPQMVEISRDGKRVYWTNSLYSTWDNQFYPEGIPGAEVMANANASGGLELAKDYFVSFPDGYRAHQIRLEGGDCSTDSFCYPSV
jgi:56kDa selenium binding protein (SBP56)